MNCFIYYSNLCILNNCLGNNRLNYPPPPPTSPALLGKCNKDINLCWSYIYIAHRNVPLRLTTGPTISEPNKTRVQTSGRLIMQVQLKHVSNKNCFSLLIGIPLLPPGHLTAPLQGGPAPVFKQYCLTCTVYPWIPRLVLTYTHSISHLHDFPNISNRSYLQAGHSNRQKYIFIPEGTRRSWKGQSRVP